MRNGLKFWLNFLCLVFVAHSHIVHTPTCGFLQRLDFLVIPLFSMLAGVSWGGLLKKTGGAGTWYGLKMLLLPYFFWLATYFVLNYVVLDVFVRRESWGVSWFDALFFILTGYCGIQMWFLVTLVYAMLIFLCMFKAFGNSPAFCFATFVLLVAALWLPDAQFVQSASGRLRYVEYYRVWFSWLFPGFCIGVLLSLPKARGYDAPWMRKYVVPALSALGFAWLFWGRGRGIALPAAAALVVAACALPKVYAPKWLSATAPYTMGIYLVHALFTSALNVVFNSTPDNPISEWVAWPASVAIFFVSWWAVRVLRRIPYMANFV